MTEATDFGRRVAIATPTYRRNDQLAELLPQLVEEARSIRPQATVIVADNDPSAGAEAVVARWAADGVRYVHEPRPGLAAVRNRLLDEAGEVDALVFIDDDEWPSSGWLRQLVGTWQKYASAAVCGPVQSIFPSEPDRWLSATGVFDRARRATGAQLSGGASNNLLLDLTWLRTTGLRFDQAFGETGGEDTMLMHSIVAAGGQIRWCDEAEVYERVPTTRMSRSWIAKRVVRTSNTWARVELIIASRHSRPLKRRAWVAARAPYFGLRGVVTVAAGAIRRDPATSARGACDLYRSIGVARAVLGSVSAEYRRQPVG